MKPYQVLEAHSPALRLNNDRLLVNESLRDIQMESLFFIICH